MSATVLHERRNLNLANGGMMSVIRKRLSWCLMASAGLAFLFTALISLSELWSGRPLLTFPNLLMGFLKVTAAWFAVFLTVSSFASYAQWMLKEFGLFGWYFAWVMTFVSAGFIGYQSMQFLEDYLWWRLGVILIAAILGGYFPVYCVFETCFSKSGSSGRQS